MSTYQIAAVAERTGFTPATLRYYDDIGLMTPVGRTPVGYRLYDDASLQRLRFIARAKQLGCSLEEITELAAVWDGGDCGPVQDQLRARVEAKIEDAQDQIAELRTFTAELQAVVSALSGPHPAGPCDDACGCTAETASTATPPAGSSIPIACSLEAGAMTSRIDDWQAVLSGVRDRLRMDDGIRLEFARDADVAEIARLAAAEQDCCRFFSLALVMDNRGIALEVHAPPDAADFVEGLFGKPTSARHEYATPR